MSVYRTIGPALVLLVKMSIIEKKHKAFFRTFTVNSKVILTHVCYIFVISTIYFVLRLCSHALRNLMCSSRLIHTVVF